MIQIKNTFKSTIVNHFQMILCFCIFLICSIPDQATSHIRNHFQAASESKEISVQANQSLKREHDLAVSEIDAKQAKFRKKFQRAVDSTISIEPIEKRLEYSQNTPTSQNLFYQAPHFYSEQHSFLYRLACF